ncbi:MAG TPA: DMT family transporter [Gemmatimonadales bacterium]
MNPRLQIALAAVLFSTGGAAIKLTGFMGWQVLAFRAMVAFSTILVLVPEARRSWGWRTALVGLGYGATTLLYVQANKLTTAANTVFLQNTNPLFLLALGPVLLGERATRRDMGYIGVLGVGMALFFVGTPQAFATAPNPMLGNILAATCSLTWALTLVGYRWLSRQGISIAAAAAIGNLLAAAIALPNALPVTGGQTADWLVVLYLGVLQLGLPYVFLTRAIPRVTALEASLVLLIEPVLNPIWAWWLHGETVGGWALLGGSVILAAIVHRTLTK